MAKLLILGGTSWLAYQLLTYNELKKDLKLDEIVTTSRGGVVYPNGVSRVALAKSAHAYLQIVKDEDPEYLINFSRGEDDVDYGAHKSIAEFTARSGCIYIYVSSAQVFDGNNSGIHFEGDQPQPESHYGKFKYKCENLLIDSGGRWVILRFSSVQGWAPHKVTRNEKFLSTLAKYENVYVDEGVLQNRLYIEDMICMCVAIMKKKKLGIYHLGTTDHSEEIDFLKKQAVLFGYDPELIKPRNKRNVNLVTVPGRINDLQGFDFVRSEQDTLMRLAQNRELIKLRNPK